MLSQKFGSSSENIQDPCWSASEYYEKNVYKYIVSIYGESDLIPEKITQFVFKGSSIAKVDIPDMIFPNEHIDMEIRHGSRKLYMSYI